MQVAARTSDEAVKWLDWPDYLRLVQELKRECAGMRMHALPPGFQTLGTPAKIYQIYLQ